MSESLSDEEEDETREEKSNREVRAKVKAYLIKIVEKLLKNDSFSKRNDSLR